MNTNDIKNFARAFSWEQAEEVAQRWFSKNLLERAYNEDLDKRLLLASGNVPGSPKTSRLYELFDCLMKGEDADEEAVGYFNTYMNDGVAWSNK